MIEPKVSVAGGMLTITIPLREAVKQRADSKSGKSLLLASIRERVDTEEAGLINIGLNVYQKNPAYTKELAEALAKLEADEEAKRSAIALEQAQAEFRRRHGDSEMPVVKHTVSK